MKLEDQVCSLELAKRLKELGVNQGGALFHWYCQLGGMVIDLEFRGKWILRPLSDEPKGFGEQVSAFTVAELGEMFPPLTQTNFLNDGRWFCRSVECGQSFFSDTEADARAKMLIYLIEKGLAGGKAT